MRRCMTFCKDYSRLSKMAIVLVALLGLLNVACSGPDNKDLESSFQGQVSNAEVETTTIPVYATRSASHTSVPSNTPTEQLSVPTVTEVSAPTPTNSVQAVSPTSTPTVTPTNVTEAASPTSIPTSTEVTGYVYNPDTSDPAYCALANRPSADDERAATWTSVCFPTPTVVLSPPLTQAYLKPGFAIRAAMTELGIDPDANNPLVQRVYHSTLAMTKGYHLVTVDLGRFNMDTEYFFDWLLYIITLRNQIGTAAELEAITDLAGEQAYTAIYEPDTDIGIQIRLLEFGVHPILPGFGPEVYWEYLIEPAAALAGRNLEWERSGFNRIVTGYQDAVFLGDAPLAGFGAYLAENGYMPPQ